MSHRNDNEDEAGKWRRWLAAAVEPSCNAALRDLYDRVDRDIATRNADCEQSGRCCHFDSYGHRLYLTALEVAWLVHRLDEQGVARPSNPTELPKLDGCPYQVGQGCSIHSSRPIGCRIFFCDSGADQWLGPMCEQFHNELRKMHEQYDIEYSYTEWRAALSCALQYL